MNFQHFYIWHTLMTHKEHTKRLETFIITHTLYNLIVSAIWMMDCANHPLPSWTYLPQPASRVLLSNSRSFLLHCYHNKGPCCKIERLCRSLWLLKVISSCKVERKCSHFEGVKPFTIHIFQPSIFHILSNLNKKIAVESHSIEVNGA